MYNESQNIDLYNKPIGAIFKVDNGINETGTMTPAMIAGCSDHVRSNRLRVY